MAVYVASHKAVHLNGALPSCYKWVYVGDNKEKLHQEGISFRDDDGTNIAERNRSFCELTALYWIWKNRNDSYKGLCHYRRFFSTTLFSKRLESCLDEADIVSRLSQYDCIVPLKAYTNMPVDFRYCIGHSSEDWDALRESIKLVSPDYFDDFTRITKDEFFYPGNMIIANTSVFDDYCEWLFAILFSVESMISLVGRDSYQSRAFGFMSERLLRVWLLHNHIKFVECPVMNLDAKLHSIIRVYLDNKLGRPIPRLHDPITKKVRAGKIGN